MSNPLNIFNNNQLFSNGPNQQQQQQPQVYNPFLNQPVGMGMQGVQGGAQRFPSQQQPINPVANLFVPPQQNFQQPPNPFMNAPLPIQNPFVNPIQNQIQNPIQNPMQNGQQRNIFGVDFKANNQQVGQNLFQNNQYGNANPFAPPTDQYQQSQQIFQQYQVPQYQRPFEYDNRYADPGQMANDFLKNKNVPLERFKNFNNYTYIYYDDQLEDDVSDLQWCTTLNRFNYYATSSWDGVVRIYEVKQKTMANDSCEMQLKSGFQFEIPVVSLTWHPEGNYIFCSTTDYYIQQIDLHSQQISQVAVHSDSIAQKVFYNKLFGLISVGFDKKIQFWDLRSQRPTQILDCDLEITDACQDLNQDVMAFVDVGPNLKILDYERLRGRYDIRTLFINEASRLGEKSMLSSVSIDLNSKSLTYGSVDGRVTTNFITPRLDVKNEVTFKNSNLKGDEPDRHLSSASLVGKVTALQLYPIKSPNQFLMAGCSDGRIIFWETNKRAKVGFIEFPQSQVVKAQISAEGKYVAFALGYTWSEGLWGANKASNPFTGVFPIEDSQKKCIIENTLQRQYRD